MKDLVGVSCLVASRLDFALVIGFGIVGAVLIVVGLLSALMGFGGSFGSGLIIFGVLFLFAAFLLGVEFGFIPGKGTLGPIPSGPF